MPQAEQHDGALSLTGELFLIAIDPATGRLVKRKRRRFRKALAATSPGGATSARGAAVRDLRARGFIERSFVPGRYPIVQGSGYGASLARVRRAITSGNFNDDRDIRLFAFLAWTGVLGQRLARGDRRTAARRIKALLTPPPARYTELHPMSPIAHALGQVAYREQMDLVQEMVGDFLSGDSISLDLGTGSDGGTGWVAAVEETAGTNH